MKKLFLFLLTSQQIFFIHAEEGHDSTFQSDNRVTSAQDQYNKQVEKINADREDQKKVITAKYEAQRKSNQPKDTSSTTPDETSVTSQEPKAKKTDAFNFDSVSKTMNNLKTQRQQEDEARQKLWDSEDKAAAKVRDKQGLAERIFFATSADSGIDTEEQLARNKQIVDTNRTRVFEDLTMKAEHFKALETAHSDFFNKNESWKTLLKLGDTQSFINDPVEKRTEFLKNLNDTLKDDNTFNITDEAGKNALRDLLKLTQLHTTGSTELDPNLENLLKNEVNEANQQELSDTLKKFLKEAMQAGIKKLERFSENIEKIKAELVTKLAAVQQVKQISNTMTVALGAAAVLGLSNDVNTMYEHIKMSMETFAIGAKGAFIGAHLSEHSETSLIRQLQDAFIDTFQPLLPKTTELLQTVSYKNEAESAGSRLGKKFKSDKPEPVQKFKYKTTDLTQTLMNYTNVNSPEFKKDLNTLKNDLRNSYFQDSKIHELLEIINQDPSSKAAMFITRMLRDSSFHIKMIDGKHKYYDVSYFTKKEYEPSSFHSLGKAAKEAASSAAKAVRSAAASTATKVNDATTFESTKLTKDLLKNPNSSNIDAEVQKIVNEVAQGTLKNQKISSIIDLINKDPQNSAAKKIIEKLNSYNYLDNYEKTATGKWEKKSSGLFSTFTKFIKEKSSQAFNTLFSNKKAQDDIFEEYKLQTNNSKLSDAQLKVKMDKELKQIEITRAQKELEAYQEYKQKSGNSSNSLDLEEFKKADALLTLEQEMADLVRKEEWNKKDKNYAKIRNERSWAEKFIKQLTTDSAADHERTNTRNEVILETNIKRMNKDFEVKKQRFNSFKEKYSEFSEKAPWKNLLELNDTQNFITMTYEERTAMLNKVDSAVQEFLTSEQNLDNKHMSAIQDFIKLNNYYLNNNQELPDNINSLLTSEASQADQTQLSKALKAFFKTTIQSSIHMMHVFNENMKDIQGSVKTLEDLKGTKDFAYGALMVSSLVGTGAFFARLHGLVEPMAAIAKISLGVAHVYTEKEAHLAQTIQDTYKDSFSKLLPKSTKLIQTTVHVNMGKSAIEFESTNLTKQLMSMDPTDSEFKNTLNKLRLEISTRSYSETYRVKRIESLLDIVNSNPESPAAKKIVDLFNEEVMVNKSKILEDHVIKKENGKWVIRSKKSNSIEAVKDLLNANNTHDYPKLLDKIKTNLQDELSGLSPEQKKETVQSILTEINDWVDKNQNNASNTTKIPEFEKIIQFLNTASTKPSLTTKAKRVLSNFFNSTESKPEKLILGNDFIERENDGNWVLKPRVDSETLKNLMRTNILDNKFNSDISKFNQELTNITDPQILLDRVDSLLDIINETPNSSSAQKIVKNINEKILKDKNYALEQEDGKWKMVSQESIKTKIVSQESLQITNKILTQITVDLKTKSALIQELSILSPELRTKQIQKILDLLNKSENKTNASIIANLLNSSEAEKILGDYNITKDNDGKYKLEPKTKIKRNIKSILTFIDKLNKFSDDPQELLKDQKTGVKINNVNLDSLFPEIKNIPLENLVKNFSELPTDLFHDTMKKFLEKINILEKSTKNENKSIDFTIKYLNLNALEKSPYKIVKVNNEYVLQPKKSSDLESKKSSDLSLAPNSTQSTPSPSAKSSQTA